MLFLVRIFLWEFTVSFWNSSDISHKFIFKNFRNCIEKIRNYVIKYGNCLCFKFITNNYFTPSFAFYVVSWAFFPFLIYFETRLHNFEQLRKQFKQSKFFIIEPHYFLINADLEWKLKKFRTQTKISCRKFICVAFNRSCSLMLSIFRKGMELLLQLRIYF